MMKELKSFLFVLVCIAFFYGLLVLMFWTITWITGSLLGDSSSLPSMKKDAYFAFLITLCAAIIRFVVGSERISGSKTDSSIVSVSPVSGESVSTIKNIVNILVTSFLCSTIVVFGLYGVDHVFGMENYRFGDTLAEVVVKMCIISPVFGIILSLIARRLKQEGKPFTPFGYVASRPSLYTAVGFYLLIFFVCLGIGHIALQTVSDVLVYLLVGLVSVVGTSLLMYYLKNVRKVSAA